MFQQLLGCRSLVRFLPQTLSDHLPEDLGVGLVLLLVVGSGLEGWWVVLQRQHQHLPRPQMQITDQTFEVHYEAHLSEQVITKQFRQLLNQVR